MNGKLVSSDRDRDIRTPKETGPSALIPSSQSPIFDPQCQVPSSDIAISVKNLSKKYHLYDSPQHRLKEALHPFRKRYHRDYWALRNIDFELKKGETIGIIGQNGSGKSTLLKIIAGVLTPSEGIVIVNGKASALLELGTGFNMEYTGIENIYFSGTVMGFAREEMNAKLDEILSFADIGDFVYQPVKVYSSGMFVRLAFAVAMVFDTEILIVDEALSVGDAKFQRKCWAKFDVFRSSGKTILFVSHDINTINRLCNRAILLNEGKIIAEGTAQNVTKTYHKMLFGGKKTVEDESDPRDIDKSMETSEEVLQANSQEQLQGNTDAGTCEVCKDVSVGGGPPEAEREETDIQPSPRETRYGDKKAEIFDMGILDDRLRKVDILETGGKYIIFFRVLFHDSLDDLTLGCRILNIKGVDIFAANTFYHKIVIPPQDKGNILECRFEVKMNLGPGDFFLTFGVRSLDNEFFYDRRVDAYHFRVQAGSHMDSVCLANLEERLSVCNVEKTTIPYGEVVHDKGDK